MTNALTVEQVCWRKLRPTSAFILLRVSGSFWLVDYLQ